MMLAVFRPRQRVSQLSQGDLIRGAATEDDVDLIDLAIRTRKPAMIGLGGEVIVIKPQEAGDEAHSFEALQDICLTVADLRLMHRRGATRPEDLGNIGILVDVEFAVDGPFALRMVLAARGSAEVHQCFAELAGKDPAFRAALRNAIGERLVRDLDRIALRIRETTEIARQPPENPAWRILDDE